MGWVPLPLRPLPAGATEEQRMQAFERVEAQLPQGSILCALFGHKMREAHDMEFRLRGYRFACRRCKHKRFSPLMVL